MARRRRSRDEARTEILDAAAALLAEGGPGAVQVRAVADRVGMTDAGVGHHVGSRDRLLEELLRYGGRRLVDTIDAAVEAWRRGDASLESLVTALADVYRSGYADLAVSLYRAGWRSRRDGLLEPVVQALHSQRRDPAASIEETRFAVAAMHQAVALDPVFGAEFRRSAAIVGTADDVDRWWAGVLRSTLGVS